jgi:hypothetical protein
MAKLNVLSDSGCRNATANGNGIRKLHDGGGLYLWVYADGRKYWRLRYKIAGSEKSLSLGVYPAIGPKKARTRRDLERPRLDDNLDPAAERRADKARKHVAAANSFEAVAREWYEKQAKTWVTGHAEDVRRRLRVSYSDTHMWRAQFVARKSVQLILPLVSSIWTIGY